MDGFLSLTFIVIHLEIEFIFVEKNKNGVVLSVLKKVRNVTIKDVTKKIDAQRHRWPIFKYFSSMMHNSGQLILCIGACWGLLNFANAKVKYKYYMQFCLYLCTGTYACIICIAAQKQYKVYIFASYLYLEIPIKIVILQFCTVKYEIASSCNSIDILNFIANTCFLP